MSRIRIKKGYNIRIAGLPADEIIAGKIPSRISIQPNTFKSIKPKLLVKEGDSVQLGAALFFDKNNPTIKWASPGAGTIKSIQYGPRRVIDNIIIEIDREEEKIIGQSYDSEAIHSLGADVVKNRIIDGNLFPMIRQRPFNKIPNPDRLPDAIFISGLNTAPLAVNLELALLERLESFQAGIDALSQLTKGKTYLTVPNETVLSHINNCEINYISGPHPAGNVGIQIHHISPLKPEKIIWTIDAQHVATIGDLFLTGSYNPEIVVSVAGPMVKAPTHIKARIGSSINTLIHDNFKDGQSRIISGNVLTGVQSSSDGFIGFYDSAITIIPESDEREFLGWLKPGSSTTRYSLTNAYFKNGAQSFPFDSSINGGVRALVPIDAWENVLPMDIMPIALFRSIIAKDIEEMEQLGIIECDPEDFALCSFACPSKIELSAIIRSGLDMVEAEG